MTIGLAGDNLLNEQIQSYFVQTEVLQPGLGVRVFTNVILVPGLCFGPFFRVFRHGINAQIDSDQSGIVPVLAKSGSRWGQGHRSALF